MPERCTSSVTSRLPSLIDRHSLSLRQTLRAPILEPVCASTRLHITRSSFAFADSALSDDADGDVDVDEVAAGDAGEG